jgi:chromosome segregation ATPase
MSVKEESRARMQETIDQLHKDYSELTKQFSAKSKEINTMNERVEGLEKDLQGARYENQLLQQNLQRALGYIDRVNEDEEVPSPIAEEIQTRRTRGPRVDSIGANFANDMHAGSQYGLAGEIRRGRDGRY